MKDPKKAIRDLADFLKKPLSEQQVESVAYHTHFDQMRTNQLANHESNNSVGEFDFEAAKFMRSGMIWLSSQILNCFELQLVFCDTGKVGGCKKYLSADQKDRINSWMEKNLHRADLSGLTEKFPETFKIE